MTRRVTLACGHAVPRNWTKRKRCPACAKERRIEYERRKAAEEYSPQPHPFIRVEEVKQRVARFYELPEQAMIWPIRVRSVAGPRQTAMYLARKLTRASLPQIARRFRRDHTTVIHAVRAVEQRRQTDPALDAAIRLLEQELGA